MSSKGLTGQQFLRLAMGLLVVLPLMATTAGAAQNDVSGGAVEGQHAAHMTRAARAGGLDTDGDGIADYADNCVDLANPDQRDTNQDGYGNLCDADLDNDGITNFVDLSLFKSVFLTADADADLDGDGNVNFVDLSLMKGLFLTPPGDSGMSCAGTVPCPGPLQFDWPMPGNDSEDWVINNYVDLNAGVGLLDYLGGGKTYDGHNGVDIDVANFRAMEADFPILAAADGVVVDLADDNPDRNMFCTGNWNFVTIGHANGWRTIYGHLKSSSVTVSVGQSVSAGDVLGVVGSSGCSTAPHLHFEVRDDQDNVISPFQQAMWTAPPVYDTPLGLLDVTVRDIPITEFAEVIDPPPNAPLIPQGHVLGIGLSVGGGTVGDTLRWRVANSANVTTHEFEFTFTQTWRHTFWWLNFGLDTGLPSGVYTVEIFTNGQLAQSVDFTMAPYPSDWQQVHHAVPVGDFQQVLDAADAAGYTLNWVDGYEVNNNTFINAVFDQAPRGRDAVAFNLNATQYQNMFNDLVANGYRLVHIDSYLVNGQVQYAPIFLQQGGAAFSAYHGASVATHQANFASLAGSGFVAQVISHVDVNGVEQVTGLYSTKPVGPGSWFAAENMTSADYQANFDLNTNAGRTLRYLNGYTRAGQTRFAAVWADDNPVGWVARHDMLESQYQTEAATWASAGFITRLLTGYDNGAGVANFGAYWSD